MKKIYLIAGLVAIAAFSVGQFASPSTGTLTLVGVAPDIAKAVVITPARGQLTLVGSAPVVQNPNWTPINDGQTPGWSAINDSQTPGWTNINDSQTPNWLPIAA